ncbi:MAG: bifunctional alpha/beta hydrolase/OsmC family protein [Pseudomonadota bacterium]
MKTTKIEFTGHSGETLAARLDSPDDAPKAHALFAHCFTCSKDLAAARRVAARLASLGIAVLRFDFTGLGHSEGEFGNTSFTSNVQDLLAAAAWMRAEASAPALIIGHSLGGAAVIKAASEIPEIKAVVTIGAPHDPGHVLENFACDIDDIREKGRAEVMLAGRRFTIGKQFVDDVSSVSLDAALGQLRKALLVLHAPTDRTVGIENASAIFLAAKHPKSFVTLDDADHLLSRQEDADYAADVIAAWSRRYLGLKDEAPKVLTHEGDVLVSEADPVGFLQDVASGTKHLLADEPTSVGGTDLGFTPYQLVSAGLGACTSMTIRMYARRKGWPLEHVAVEIEHNKVHASDCETCETESGKVDVFRRAIRLVGDLTDEQRAKCMEIADKCPVHRTLESEIKVETEEKT